MSPKSRKIISYISANPSSTAREVAEGIFGAGYAQQIVYSDLQALCTGGLLAKFTRESDGRQAYRLKSGVPIQADRTAATLNIDVVTLREKLDGATAKVISRLKSDPHDRMHSWSHCFQYFHQFLRAQSAQSAELAALHLGFYLASYGMYRGSTRLLGKDYKFLVPVVRKLATEPFAVVGVSSFKVKEATESNRAKKLHELCNELARYFDEIGLSQKNTGTLVTKVLLGTWCNVPAFDTAFKRALRTSGFGKAVWGQKNFLRAFESLNSTADIFQSQVQRFHAAGYAEYPAIRVIDAIFWHLGGGDKLTAQGKMVS